MTCRRLSTVVPAVRIAPYPLVAATLGSGAASGMNTVAVVPSSRAARATPGLGLLRRGFVAWPRRRLGHRLLTSRRARAYSRGRCARAKAPKAVALRSWGTPPPADARAAAAWQTRPGRGGRSLRELGERDETVVGG